MLRFRSLQRGTSWLTLLKLDEFTGNQVVKLIAKCGQQQFKNIKVLVHTFQTVLEKGTLPNKTILCTFGIYTSTSTVGPEDGVCDIIILDYFYSNDMGTFLDSTKLVLRWFLRLASKNNAYTQYGIGIDHSNALRAYNDLYDAVGIRTFSDFWNQHIRHYGLLNFQVREALVTKRSTVRDYDKLLKRLRELQEVNRAGDVDKLGYIILGVGLFAPRTGNAYNYLKELLQ
ncbi:uncharacterized protein LOC121833168 [Ixodes scapularis]|uniref:uncharacterized protein LOC121833168 n=1 Tax=Ixodes scapularis TaxID=6945 RepID=UPI001C38DF7F|nr:uncharacterized protein LOC121833168 [Ixodes scapularis]